MRRQQITNISLVTIACLCGIALNAKSALISTSLEKCRTPEVNVEGEVKTQVEVEILTQDPDELFKKARTAAFDDKDYARAKNLTQQAIALAPEYWDLHLFLSRLHIWTNEIDAARTTLKFLEEQHLELEDYFTCHAGFEINFGKLGKAHQLIDRGLAHFPESEELHNLKKRLRSATYAQFPAENAVGAAYNYVRLNNTPSGAWSLWSLHYQRLTSAGPVIAKVNIADKFIGQGIQYEMEAYPRISPTFYFYLNAGYSASKDIFPKYRTGFSMYANLPYRLEGELGFRQIYFTDNIWMYTASLGKYYENFWFNLRAFVHNKDKGLAQTYSGVMRYYVKGAQNYLGLHVGTGLEPDDTRVDLLQNPLDLKTYKLGAEYNFSILRNHIVNIIGVYYNQRSPDDRIAHQLDLRLGYTYFF